MTAVNGWLSDKEEFAGAMPTRYQTRDLTIGHVLADKARRLGGKVFLTFCPDGRTFTYRDLDLVTNRLANGLAANGIGHGDHVAVVMNNSPEMLFLFFALGKIGAVTVSINTAARGELLLDYLARADVTSIILDSEYLQRYHEISHKTPFIRSIFLNADQDGTDGGSVPVVPYADLLSHSEAPPAAEVRFSDLAYLSYTSGTTGPSKANMFTQAHSLLWGHEVGTHLGYRFDDVIYICLPLFHGNGLQSTTYGALMTNASIALSRRFSASRFWMEIQESRATVFNALGSMANILWSQEPSPAEKNHRVRMTSMVPVPKFALEFEQRFNLRIVSGFGLTDYRLATVYTLTDPVEKLGSSGRARKNMEIKIVDDDDFEIPAGTIGEIILRSNELWSTSLGYYKMPEATVAAMRNGWFHTGDRGWMDEDGYLWFVDRKKDSIRRRGENISAYEVEQVLIRHPKIADVAVFPVNSDMAEDEVAAAIVLHEGANLAPEEVIRFCNDNMSYFMIPRFIRYVDDLPRTINQKVEKYKIRKEAEADISVYWDKDKVGISVSR